MNELPATYALAAAEAEAAVGPLIELDI